MTPQRRTFVTHCALLLLAGCGGGQGGASKSGNPIRPAPGSPALAAFGDSLIAGEVSPYTQAKRMATQPFYDVGNFAVPGQRTDQINQQISSGYSVRASIAIINGGVNDIVQGVEELIIRSNLIANWAACKAYQMQPFDIGMPPTNISSNVSRHIKNEIWRKLYCHRNNIRHVDIYSVLASAAGAYRDGYFADVIHYNSVGAVAAAARLLSSIQSSTNTDMPLLALTDAAADADTFLPNAVSFSGGATPTGWTEVGSGGNYSVMAPDPNDFGAWYRCGITAGSNVGMKPDGVTLASLDWAVGDRIAIGVRIRWVASAQALAVSTLFTGITTSDSPPLYQESGGEAGGSQYVFSEATITGGTLIGVEFSASGTGYFEINRPIIVNLTRLGLT